MAYELYHRTYTVLEVGLSMFLTFMYGCVWQLPLNQHDDDDDDDDV